MKLVQIHLIPDDLGSQDSSLTFGTLKQAQAVGDYNALNSKQRDVISIYFSGDLSTEIQKIIDLF